MRMRRHSLINSVAIRCLGLAASDTGTSGAPAGGQGGQGGGMNGSRPPPMSQPAQTNNQSGGDGNQQPSGDNGGTQNNPGNTFDGKSFWNKPEPASNGSPSSGGSADSKPAGSGTPAPAEHEVLATQLKNLTYPDVFTKEIGDQIAAGDLTGINKAISQQMVQSTQQAVAMSAQIMKLFGEKLMGDIEAKINGAFGNRDNADSLSKSFPSYNDPGMKPVIDGIFNHSLTLTKGNREEAIKTTREMLRYMGKSGAQDLGINEAPSGSGDSYSSSRAQSLVDELLGRG